MFDAVTELKPPTPLQVIGWWELRRPIYNAILLIVGLATLFGTIAVVGPHIPAEQDVIEPLALVSVIIPRFFLIANVCYTPGWIVDLALREFHVEITGRFRNRVFWMGVLFSCLLTSLPFWWACAYWAGKPVISR